MFPNPFGRKPAGPSSPATIEAEKRAAVETSIGRAAIVSNLTMAASAVGALQVPVISGAMAGLILLVAHVYGSVNKQSKLNELLVRIERQLLFAYYQFKVIEEAAKSANVSIDTKRVADAIESVRTAITSTLGDKSSRDKNTIGPNASRFKYVTQTFKNVFVASISDLVTYEKIIMTEVDQLRNELQEMFMIFVTKYPNTPQSILQRLGETPLVRSYKNITDDNPDNFEKELSEFNTMLANANPQEKQAAKQASTGQSVLEDPQAPPPPPPVPVSIRGGALWPLKYYRGLSTRRKSQRRREITRRAKMSWKNPAAYRPFATDRGTKRRPSSYSSRFHTKYPGVTGLPAISKATHVPLSVLEKVYDRGLAAWRTGHRPGASQHAWGMARVHSFVLHGKTWRTADADLARRNSS
jgi:hypothetical protein